MTAERPLPDVWFTRDLPELRAIVRLLDEPPHGSAPYLGAVVPASGLPKPQVVSAANALAAAGYVEAEGRVALTARGRAAADLGLRAIDEIEAGWRRVLGEDGYAGLAAALARINLQTVR